MSFATDMLKGLGYVLDTPGALTRGAIANLADVISGQNRFKGYRATGRQMLESMGMPENRPGLDWGDAAGFAADMLVDPLNLGGAAAIRKGLQGAKLALKSNKASRAMRAAGAVEHGQPMAAIAHAVPEIGRPVSAFKSIDWMYHPRNPSRLGYHEGLNNEAIRSIYQSQLNRMNTYAKLYPNSLSPKFFDEFDAVTKELSQLDDELFSYALLRQQPSEPIARMASTIGRTELPMNMQPKASVPWIAPRLQNVPWRRIPATAAAMAAQESLSDIWGRG